MKLVHSAMSDLSPSEAVNKLGSSVTFLSPKQLSEIPKDVLRKALQNLGSNAQWTQGQLQTLVKNQLGDKKVSLQGCFELLSHALTLYSSHSAFP